MARIQMRDRQDLVVKETVAEIKELVTADATFVEVTEVQRSVLRKFSTPVDTKAEFVEKEIKHLIPVAGISSIQPTVEEAEVLPVHVGQCEVPAVSGPFSHDHDPHCFETIVASAPAEQLVPTTQLNAGVLDTPVAKGIVEATEGE